MLLKLSYRSGISLSFASHAMISVSLLEHELILEEICFCRVGVFFTLGWGGGHWSSPGSGFSVRQDPAAVKRDISPAVAACLGCLQEIPFPKIYGMLPPQYDRVWISKCKTNTYIYIYVHLSIYLWLYDGLPLFASSCSTCRVCWLSRFPCAWTPIFKLSSHSSSNVIESKIRTKS